jgi:FkbM family methyltransferase
VARLDPAYWGDERQIRDAFWSPSKGDVAFDIGAAEGSYTLPALEAGAYVYAVDPVTERLEILTEIAGGAAGLAVINKALYDGTPIPAALTHDLRAEPDFAHDPDWTYSTLDTEARGLRRLDWVKIDVEGAEAGVVRGGLKTLARFRPRLLIEDHTDVYPWVKHIGSTKEILALLDGLDYVVEIAPYVGPGPPRAYFVACP